MWGALYLATSDLTPAGDLNLATSDLTPVGALKGGHIPFWQFLVRNQICYGWAAQRAGPSGKKGFRPAIWSGTPWSAPLRKSGSFWSDGVGKHSAWWSVE